MKEDEEIFRKKSLERLASPERLDQLVRVADPKGWLILATIAALVIIAIIWSIVGSIATKVGGSGVLIRTGGVFNVVAKVRGSVADLAVSKGEFIKQGDTIARISQTELLREIYLKANELREAKIKFERDTKHRAQQRKNFEEKVDNLEKRYKNQYQLYKEGLLTHQTVLDTEQQVKDTKDQISQLEVDALAEKQRVAQAERQLVLLRQQYTRSYVVSSPYTGRILEVKVSQGALVDAGTALVSMELLGRDIQNLEAIVFVPAADGKKIKPGMRVNVSPSTVNSAAFGTIIGKVARVSQFPATFAAMMKVLQNEQLVRERLAEGSVIQVDVNLTPDPKTVSGFKWTSAGGPPVEIQSGTICTADITVKTQRPISLVIPYLRRIVTK